MLILEGFCGDGSALSWAPSLLGKLGPLSLLGLMGSLGPTSCHLLSLLLLPQMGRTSSTSVSDSLHSMPLPGCSPPSTLRVHPLTSLSSLNITFPVKHLQTASFMCKLPPIPHGCALLPPPPISYRLLFSGLQSGFLPKMSPCSKSGTCK